MNDSRASDSFSPLTYAIRYIGCIPIRVSIKTLDFNTRTIIARECIHRVCEDAKLKVPSVRPAAKEVSAYIDEISDLRYAMTSVHVIISLESLVVEEFHTGSVLFRHPLGSVSFSSAGDNEMLDFVSYVAKTDDYNRMCYVFQCSNGVSRDFISSMGQAFRLAYQGFNENNFTPGRNLTCRPKLQTTNIFPSKQSLTTVNGAEESGFSQLPETNFFDLFTDGPSDSQNDVKVHQNPWPPRFPSGDRNSNAASLKYSSQPSRFPTADSNSKQTSQHISSIAEISSKNLNYLPVSHPLEPVGEPWYLGCLSRQIAESLLQYDGDFLVRASSQQPGQFVLSGLQDGKRRHLLLVNPEGQVRTRDRIFTNIQNLIDYHLRSGIPIRSADSELKLAFPVSLK